MSSSNPGHRRNRRRTGATGREITTLLPEQGIPVSFFVHEPDARCEELRRRGAQVAPPLPWGRP